MQHKLFRGTVCVATAALLAACGASSVNAPNSPPANPPASSSPPPPPPASTLSGTAAVGAPMTDATLRIIDANGTEVAKDVPVAANGSFSNVPLTGPAPWRIEVCGYQGANYGCIYSVATEAGTANVTPLTLAMMLLASGQAPGGQMSGAASGLTPQQLAAAQATLQQALNSLLLSLGLPADIDFTKADLTAGSRTGYDKLLDLVQVVTGKDGQMFVQLAPRVGTGNVYVQAGSAPTGQINASSAAQIPLASLDTLFNGMTAAVASSSACSNPTTGMAAFIAPAARMNFGTGAITGSAQVGQALCQFFGDPQAPMWGAKLLSPILGSCDTSLSPLRCRVSFALQAPNGDVQNVGDGMAVTFESGKWLFAGDFHPLAIYANANIQRIVRVDDATAPVDYMRALSFDIETAPGLNCARVAQPAEGGMTTVMAYYKRHSINAPRLSLWTTNGMGNTPSLDPAMGATRTDDDSWLALPEGMAGDTVVRNFFRAGRSVTITLYSDLACSTPLVLDGRSSFAVDVLGVPPVWAAMSEVSWPQLSSTSVDALKALTLAANANAAYTAAWTFAGSPVGFDQASFCIDGACGQDSPARIGDTFFRPSARSTVMTLGTGATPVTAGGFKMVALFGRTAEGLGVQNNFISCTAQPAGQRCM